MKQMKSSKMKEAYEYDKPSAFSRGMSVELPGNVKMLFISGTASIGEKGETLYKGDFKKQANKMFENVTDLLEKEKLTWKDVVKTTIYIRDIDRDYDNFNQVRTAFYDKVGLKPYPASTCVEAKLCRNDLLVEMDLIVIKQ